MSAESGRPDRMTLAAFGALVVLVGLNFVSIRVSNQELAPFWGAGIRFTLAAGLFAALLLARRSALPRGRALAGALLYGLVGIVAFYAFSYWALVWVPAGMGAVVGALVPLLTLFLAVAHGLERFRWRALVGAVVAAGGFALVFGQQLSADVPLVALLALCAAVVCAAETGILIKWLAPTDPVATNLVAMAFGAVVLLALSVVAGEPRAVPVQGATWAALGYLVIVGTVGVFLLFLFVLQRWQASAVAYEFVLAPVVAVVLGVWLLGEGLTPLAAMGAALVLVGVYVGALSPSPARG